MAKNSSQIAVRAGLAGFLALGPAACGPTGPIQTVNYNSVPEYDYTQEYLQLAAASGPVLLQSRGSPFPGGDPAMSQALVQVSNGLPVRIRPQYTPNPAEAGSPQGRLIYAFNSPPTLSTWQICDSRAPLPQVPPSDRLNLTVVYCFDYYPVSMITVSAPPLQPGDQQGLRQVAERVSADLFPDVRHNDNSYSKRGM
jgi:hypothetical protein